MVICFNVSFRMIVVRFHLNSLSTVFFTLRQQNDCLKWFLSDLPKIRQHRLLRSSSPPSLACTCPWRGSRCYPSQVLEVELAEIETVCTFLPQNSAGEPNISVGWLQIKTKSLPTLREKQTLGVCLC